MIVHGGDVWQVAEELGIATSQILDFSANVNPRGLPPLAQQRLVRDASDPQGLRLYPDPSARRLRHALSAHLAVTPESIVIGPGAESLLAPILRCLEPRRVLVPVPAFSEYRRICEQWKVEFVPFPLDRSESFRIPVDRLCRMLEGGSFDVLLLNNPHNPSGAMLNREETLRVAETAASAGMAFVIDEAFIDYALHASLARDAAERPGLIVVRSLTKFYGCPALRIGYTVAHPDTIRRVAALLPTWPVTQLAIDALAEAVADREYADASLRENAAARESLRASLDELGLNAFSSAANYLLFELQKHMPSAAELRMLLLRNHRILVRNCDSYEGLAAGLYTRVAVRAPDENRLLIRALRDELGS